MHRSSATFLFLTGCALVSLPAALFAQATAPAAAPAEEVPAEEVTPAEPVGDEEAASEGDASASGEAAAEQEEPTVEPGEGESQEMTSEALPEPEPMANPSESVSSEVPSPGDLAQRLNEGVEDSFDGKDTWTAPVPVFAVHGYMRMRGELMDTFWLGRPILANLASNPSPEGLGPDPFSRFRPFERTEKSVPCVNEKTINGGSSNGTDCDVSTLQFANMRLRLSPEMNLTEDVRIKSTFDVLDNVVAGNTPRSFYGTANSTTFSDTLAPAGAMMIEGSLIMARATATRCC